VASRAVEDAVTETKRLAKLGRYAAEDLVDDAAHRIKRDPLRSVALGLILPLLIGYGRAALIQQFERAARMVKKSVLIENTRDFELPHNGLDLTLRVNFLVL
jgi:hypothetical protein